MGREFKIEASSKSIQEGVQGQSVVAMKPKQKRPIVLCDWGVSE